MQKQTPSTILLDIEGTTTAISFVKDTLFPYARTNVEPFLRSNWTNAEVQGIITALRNQITQDIEDGLNPNVILEPEADREQVIQSVLENVFWQMDSDRKTTGLKSLQGLIWKDGFHQGILKGHVYEDVPEAFKRWTNSGKKLYIYSSGSVAAQILLFQHAECGDLTPMISGNFDTTTGPKIESSSYSIISSKIQVSPEDIIFFTDVSTEAYAAKEAGLNVVVMIRPGNAPLTSQELNDFSTSESFDAFV